MLGAYLADQRGERIRGGAFVFDRACHPVAVAAYAFAPLVPEEGEDFVHRLERVRCSVTDERGVSTPCVATQASEVTDQPGREGIAVHVSNQALQVIPIAHHS